MIKFTVFTVVFCLLTCMVFSQSDTAASNMRSAVFDRITKGVTAYKLDTTAAPNDKITRRIIELRGLRGGFNINEAIDFKIEEDREKNELPKADLDKFASFFKSGNGKRWLDNAMIWIYRRQFSYSEIKQLVKFYKTTAGQKMAADFPVIMMQSLRAAEMIKDLYTEQQKK